jgi:hypothetical protein
MNDMPTLSEIDRALVEIETLMPRALATDVVAFERLTALYTMTYCMKLMRMK